MTRATTHGIKGLSRMIVILAALFCGGAIAQSQTFEDVWGPRPCSEDGKRGVTPVLYCPDGGYIAVGSTNYNAATATCGNSDVYIVRTRNGGTILWEYSYDIGGLDGNDYGRSIVELNDGTGFVVTGTADLNSGSTDAFLMKIDCKGKVVWAHVYGGSRDEVGEDVVQARSYTTANPYDFVVVGSTWSTTPGTLDGYIFRTDANGNLIWDASYDVAEHEWFNALTIASPTADPSGGTQITGDIIAVGGRKAGAPYVNTPLYQGFIVRVDGTNGGINTTAPLLQNAADFGGPAASDEWFNGVVELQSTAEFPNVAVVGKTTNVMAGSDIFVVKIDGNPCNLLAQRLIGDADCQDVEEAYDVQEVANTLPIANPGDLALTGYTDFAGTNGGVDAFLLTVNPGGTDPLTPIFGSGHLYGDFADYYDDGFSLHEVRANTVTGVTAGFIIAGTTLSDLQGAGDPSDLYLIKTRDDGTTGSITSPCNNTWDPKSYDPGWAVNCLMPTIGSIGNFQDIHVLRTAHNTGYQRCFAVTGTNKGSDQNDGVSEAPEISLPEIATPGMVRSYPNPVKRGTSITIEFAPTTSSDEIELTLINSAGETVRVTAVRNQGGTLTIPIGTADLPAGAYAVMIDDGGAPATLRVVVVE